MNGRRAKNPGERHEDASTSPAPGADASGPVRDGDAGNSRRKRRPGRLLQSGVITLTRWTCWASAAISPLKTTNRSTTPMSAASVWACAVGGTVTGWPQRGGPQQSEQQRQQDAPQLTHHPDVGANSPAPVISSRTCPVPGERSRSPGLGGPGLAATVDRRRTVQPRRPRTRWADRRRGQPAFGIVGAFLPVPAVAVVQVIAQYVRSQIRRRC